MEPKVKRNLIWVGVGFLVLCVAVTGLVIFMKTRQPANPYGRWMEIANLAEYTAGRPTDTMTDYYIRYALYDVINENTEPRRSWENGEVKDIRVREGSFTQDYDSERGVHEVSFLVDSESLRQSYRVQYQWGEADDVVLAEDANAVLCVAVDEMIYEGFDCVDMWSEQGELLDPILAELPYSELGWEVVGGGVVEDQYGLRVKILLTVADTRSGEAAAVASYKRRAEEWLRGVAGDLGRDFEDYVLNYEVVRASLY